MNRRNFLAFIPAISAIPLIGKNIEQTASGIFISKPEPILIDQAGMPAHINPFMLDVRLYQGDKQVGEAFITHVDVHSESIETPCRDNGGAYTAMRGGMTMEITCQLKHWL